MTADLDKSGWVTPPEPGAYPALGDDREWAVLMRIWGTSYVYSVGSFPSWEEAEEWAEYQVIAKSATILGLAEQRRPKGTDLAARRRRRSTP